MLSPPSPFDREISTGNRFRFGENWQQFLELLTADRIAEAKESLVKALDLAEWRDRSFLDIGSGSGLFSLAARQLGARVYSIDYDPASVSCAKQLKNRFFADDPAWTIVEGSVLDTAFMASLPRFDVVYSWGVLHHTGDLLLAITNAADRVSDQGLFCIAVYRRTWLCPFWSFEKRLYCRSSEPIRRVIRAVYGAALGVAPQLKNVRGRPGRGMDYERDLHDWLGGYPYQSITPKALKSELSKRGFALLRQKVKSEGIHTTPGCDEFVFQRTS